MGSVHARCAFKVQELRLIFFKSSIIIVNTLVILGALFTHDQNVYFKISLLHNSNAGYDIYIYLSFIESSYIRCIKTTRIINK